MVVVEDVDHHRFLLPFTGGVLVMWNRRQAPHQYGRLKVNGPNFRAITEIATSAWPRVA
jgi:hypothetical protein